MASVDFDTEFWDDPVIQAASPFGKLLHAFLWTNARKNPVCIYQITIRTVCDGTGLTADQVWAAFKEISPSVKYDPEHSIVAVFAHFRRQYMKSRRLSLNWIKSAEKCLYKLPSDHPFVLEWLTRYLPLLRGCQGVTQGLEGVMEGLENFSKSLTFKDSHSCEEGVTKGLPNPPGKGKGKGPASSSFKEGGAGGDSGKETEGRGDGETGLRRGDEGTDETRRGGKETDPQGPNVGPKVKIIAHEKSIVAFREFQAEIEKRINGNGRLAIKDPISRKIFYELGQIDGITAMKNRDGPDALGAEFRRRYRQCEIEMFVKNKGG